MPYRPRSQAPGAGVTAILGPTNTGKTYRAIERMMTHETGVIGLPLRLLAREVYLKLCARAGEAHVALVTGEEKIIPLEPRYWVSTVEAMPRDLDVDFVCVDEVQLAANLERGHVFTDRILNVRGKLETLLLGAATIRTLLTHLLPGITIEQRPRLSLITYSGSKKITRQPRRTAVVAFSANDVYSIAELIRRQRGGAAVVLGALSPRTRNAQVDLYQNGDVDFLVATDAIGMGLNLDVDHIAFAGRHKFDGFDYRELTAAEMGQLAGRAGRHTRDGTFGVTGRTEPLDDFLVEKLETHAFEPVKRLQWRNADLDFASIEALRASLDDIPDHPLLTRALPQEDADTLDAVLRDKTMRDRATSEARMRILWDACQLPDYRKIAPAQHVEIVGQLFAHLCDHDRVPEDWMASQLKNTDRVDGDIDALSARIAHVRTWTFVANRNAWLQDPMHWQERTRALEDRLSDALHEKLTQRFVDRRTSVLMRRLREKDVLDAIIAPNGDVQVEGQHIGWLAGFRFTPDSTADDLDGKAVRAAAQKALAAEIQRRAEKVALADDGAFALDADGGLRWIGEVIAKLSASDDVLRPKIILLADEQLTGGAREMVDERLGKWLDGQVTTHLGSLKALRDGDGLEALARGIGFRLAEAMGNIDRREIADDVKALDQDARATLRKHGVRFGAYTVFVPHLLKPAPVNLLSLLWALANGGTDKPGLRELPQLNASGRTSIPVDPAFDVGLYPICGFRVCGGRAVRFDILERLADIIRPLIAFRPSPPPEASGEKSADLNSPNQTMGEDPSSTDGSVEPKAGGELPKGTDAGAAPQQPEPELHERAPEGAAPGNGFYVTVEMTSLLGCAGEDFANVLKSLGYRVERKTVPAAAGTPAVSEAPTEDPEPPTEHKETVGSASEDVVEQAESTTPPAATDADGTSAVEPPTEQIIEVWRPAGGGNRRRQGARPQGRRQGKMGAGQDASSKPNGDRRNEGRGNNRKAFKGGKSPRRDDKRDQRKPKDYSAGPPNKGRGPDPDSPFAALAGLLDKKDGDG